MNYCLNFVNIFQAPAAKLLPETGALAPGGSFAPGQGRDLLFSSASNKELLEEPRLPAGQQAVGAAALKGFSLCHCLQTCCL